MDNICIKGWQDKSDAVLKDAGFFPSRLEQIRVVPPGLSSLYSRNLDAIVLPSRPPWMQLVPANLEFIIKVAGTARSEPSMKRFEALKKALSDSEVEYDFQLWTDGSVCNSQGKAAALLFEGSVELTVVRPGFCKGGKRLRRHVEPVRSITISTGSTTSSTMAELQGLAAGLKLLKELPTLKNANILVATDSQAGLMSLRRGQAYCFNAILQELWTLLWIICSEANLVTLIHTPGHAGVYPNELADLTAQKVPDPDTPAPCVALDDLKNILKRRQTLKWRSERVMPSHRSRLFGDKPVANKGVTLTRHEEVLLSQLRTGECRYFGPWLRRTGIVSKGTPCRWCKAAAETVEHVLLECPTLDAERLTCKIPRPAELSDCLAPAMAKHLASFVALAMRKLSMQTSKGTKRKAETEDEGSSVRRRVGCEDD